MKAQPTAAGLRHGPSRPGPRAAESAGPGDGGEPVSARVAEARSRARERRDAQRQALRPLGLVFIAVVVTMSALTQPAPGLHGKGLAVTLVLVAYGAAVLAAISVRWTHRGLAAQALVIGLIGGCGVALAVLQPQGVAELAASLGVWFAAVRLPLVPAAVTAGAITAALALAIAVTSKHQAVQSAFAATLLCLLLAVIGQFLRRGWESQDRTELLMAQLQDAREAEAAAAALAERTHIAGELHDVLAHSLSALAIQLQGARKLADREQVGDDLRATIERSAELTKAGLADARQAVGALRGDQLPTLDQLSALVEDFRHNTGTGATLRICGTSRALPAEASLALYRGAQEALTNISRYAPGATTSVTVSYQPDRTVVTVEDHIPRPQAAVGPAAGSRSPAEPDAVGESRPTLLTEVGGGHGLAAMRERAQRAGGTARAGPTADGWLVELEVPV
jgi:signal transduction histidine kinase